MRLIISIMLSNRIFYALAESLRPVRSWSARKHARRNDCHQRYMSSIIRNIARHLVGLSVKKSRIRIGGPFPKGTEVIDKLRALTVYFNTPQRRARLEQVKREFRLPLARAHVHPDTRVGFVSNLFASSLLNYTSYRKYVYIIMGLLLYS